jgi:hypothetical protein
LFGAAPAIKVRFNGGSAGTTMLKPLYAALALLSAVACTQSGAGGANTPGATNTLNAPAAAGVQAPAGGGMIGADLTAVRQGSDFFNFFHLAPTGPANAQGVIDFRPSGSQFDQLVDVTVTVDGSDRITAMSLTLTRSFIDDPANGPFARDIAKSFLQAAPPPADAQQVSGLTNDINRAGGPAAAPGYVPQTPAYAVFAGASQAPVAVGLASTAFAMAPSSEAGAPALTLSFTAR